ncbi:MAG: YceI family protein, partial [Gammaproteobacteria bacterium]
IAGTRRNMLGDGVLDAGNFPEIRLTSRRVAGKAPDYQVTVAVEVKGRTHDVVVPVHVEQAPGQLRATGQLTVTHADLGLTPFSVMGGLLSVRNEITLRFRIVARPLP